MLSVKRASRIPRSRSSVTVGLIGSSNRGIADALKPSPQAQADSQGKTEAPKHAVNKSATTTLEAKNPKKKTMAELDAELRQKMSGMAGDGGAAGIEYEDGKPVAMKRGVRNNMFRYI